MSTKERIKEELLKARTWLSATDLVDLVQVGHSTVSRALRKLWEENFAAKNKLPGDRYGRMQWVAKVNVFQNFPNAMIPTKTVWVKPGQKQRKISKHMKKSQTTASTTQGDLDMQIEDGVATIVGELVAADKKFSAHDVTKELRDRVNAGTIQIDAAQAGTVRVAGKDVTNVDHNAVKIHVHTLMTSGKFPQYDRQHNGTYFEYAPAQAAPPTAAPTTGGSAPPTSDGGSYDGGPTL